MTQSEALNPDTRNVTLTSADTEYVVPVPKGMKYASMKCRTSFDVRTAFVKGQVATAVGSNTNPYITIDSGESYSTPEKVSWSRTLINQVDLITVAGTWLQNETVTMVVGTSTIVVTIGTLVTAAQVATTLREAWNNETFTDAAASKTPANGGMESRVTSRIEADNMDTTDTAAAIVYLTNEVAGESFTLVVTTNSVSGTPTESTDTAASNNKAKLFFATAEAGVVVEVQFFKSFVS